MTHQATPTLMNQVSRAVAPKAELIGHLADAAAHLAKTTGFAGRAQLIRQGFDPDDLDRWGLTAWCAAIRDHGVDPRLTDICPTGILTGTPPFRLRQWVTHRETGVTGEVIAQQPKDGGLHQGAPLPPVWMVTIKTAAGPQSGPASTFKGD